MVSNLLPVAFHRQTNRRDTHLNLIQLIPSDNNLHPCVTLPQELDPIRHVRLASPLSQCTHVDPHREHSYVDKPSSTFARAAGDAVFNLFEQY
jgi:hypothetical protein